MQTEQMYTGDSPGVLVKLIDLKKRMNDALDAAGHGSLKGNRGAGGNTGARTQAMHKAVEQAIHLCACTWPRGMPFLVPWPHCARR
jgi:hypothetical protein